MTEQGFQDEKRELDLWIQKATTRLCPMAKRQVRDEIENHYAGELETALVSGVTEREAHREAMTSLGSSLKACYRFEKTHLTGADARLLKHVFKPRTLKKFAILTVAQFAVLTTLFSVVWHYDSRGGGVSDS